MKRWGRRGAVLGFAMLLATSGCAGAGGGGGGGGGGENSVSVLMVNNPQMVDLQKLTADNFTKQTGITVNYTVLPENDVRDKISQEFSSQAGQYDVASLSNFEIPIYAKNGWLAPMDDYVAKDPAFNQADILKPMAVSLTAADGKLYGQPFYGESSFLMYRKDVLQAKGITMPDKPTWQQVADIAAKADGAQPNMKGICLRGQPGWGEVFAPLTTVVNTFGGTWFEKDWTRQGQRAGVQGRHQLLRQPGQGARRERRPAGGLHRVPERHAAGQRRDVVRRDVGGGLARGRPTPRSRARSGTSPPRSTRPRRPGWLYTWAWAIQKASKKQDNAWKFISWASSAGLREPRGSAGGLGEGARGQARLDLLQP